MKTTKPMYLLVRKSNMKSVCELTSLKAVDQVNANVKSKYLAMTARAYVLMRTKVYFPNMIAA